MTNSGMFILKLVRYKVICKPHIVVGLSIIINVVPQSEPMVLAIPVMFNYIGFSIFDGFITLWASSIELSQGYIGGMSIPVFLIVLDWISKRSSNDHVLKNLKYLGIISYKFITSIQCTWDQFIINWLILEACHPNRFLRFYLRRVFNSIK